MVKTGLPKSGDIEKRQEMLARLSGRVWFPDVLDENVGESE